MSSHQYFKYFKDDSEIFKKNFLIKKQKDIMATAKNQWREKNLFLSAIQKEELIEQYREKFLDLSVIELTDQLQAAQEEFEKDQLKIKVLRELLKDAELERDDFYPES